MLRILFAVLLLLHGAIHLMGFAKGFQLAEMKQLTRPIGRRAGVFWLLGAALFAVAAVLFIFKMSAWWLPAVLAILLSQALILGSWTNARFGTVANIIVAVVALLAFFDGRFQKMAQTERMALLNQTQSAPLVQDPDSLPPTVQRWLRRSGAIEKPPVSAVYLRQNGRMRTAPDGKWMLFEADQYFSVQAPAFHWMTDVEAFPLVYMSGRDQFADGRGHMLIKLESAIPVVDARGPEIDQGTLLRYMGEICWFPSAALSEYFTWEATAKPNVVKSTLQVGENSASGMFYFDAEGDPLRFEARRFYTRKEGATLENWMVQNLEYREFQGVRVPSKCAVTWKLAEGDFTWLELEIEDIRFDSAANDALRRTFAR